MKEEFANLAESQDPFGFDIFLSVEIYHETITSLAGLYFQLWFKEQRKPAAFKNPDLADKFLNLHKEISSMKHRFRINEISERNQATEMYSQELRKLRDRHL
jgi:hypothetical protein